jgi:hypothetical protein
MTSYELRATIEMKNQRIESLLQEKEVLLKKIDVLEDWNSRWQTERWNQELVRQCAGLVNECSNPQKRILEYLASVQGHKAQRHVRGIARVTGLNITIVSINLRELQHKKLVRAYICGSKKNYYTLPYIVEQTIPVKP